MRPTVLVSSAFLLVALAIDAQAQEKRVNFGIGGGFTMPNAEVSDHFGNGYNFTLGLQVNVTPIIGIEGAYSFNGLGDKQITIGLTPTPTPQAEIPTDFFADMNMQYGTANLVLQKPGGMLRPYGLVGMGVYYRPVKITTPGVGYAPGFCNPWWYVCVPGGFVPVENIVGDRSSTDFGMDFGGGVNIGPAYAELRYHYIWGPTPTVNSQSPAANAEGADGQFLLTTFGFRF